MKLKVAPRKGPPGLIGMLLIAAAIGSGAQQPNLPAQRTAMQRLAFLSGHWSGPVSVKRGPGEPLKLTQTETAQYKLDGLVMLIEGRSIGPDGKAQFQALATIAYDDASQTYRFRAYNEGRYLDAELAVVAGGFSWGFNAGPAKVRNTMKLTAQGEWQEATEFTMGGSPPQRSVEMLLKRDTSERGDR